MACVNKYDALQPKPTRAVHVLRAAGSKYHANLLGTGNAHMELRSKDPAVCWKRLGQVHFSVLSEYCGPTTRSCKDAPFLLQARVNICPPIGLYFHLKSTAVQCRLGLSDKPVISTDPRVTFVHAPDESGCVGLWLYDWLAAHYCNQPRLPKTQLEIITPKWGTDLKSVVDLDLEELGPDWLKEENLWTVRANRLFNDWLAGGKK
jgi:hypothetical protein